MPRESYICLSLITVGQVGKYAGSFAPVDHQGLGLLPLVTHLAQPLLLSTWANLVDQCQVQVPAHGKDKKSMEN